MTSYAVREPAPPVAKIVIELSVEEAVELQCTITSGSPEHMRMKDRVYQALTDIFRREGIRGGIYV